MELIAEVPPPLPPKTNKSNPSFPTSTTISIAPPQPPHNHITSPPQSLHLPITGPHSSAQDRLPQPDTETATVVTWGSSSRHPEGSLYENVSSGGKRKTPKIEVRQEDNKTVVKISVKESPAAEEEMKVLSGDVERKMEDGEIYENVVGEEGWYENVSEKMSKRGSSKELKSEVNYCGVEAVCDVWKSGVEGNEENYENVDYRVYENVYRKGDERGGKNEGEKPQKATLVKVEKSEGEYDDNSSGDPFDSGTCSDVDSLPNMVQTKKGNVIVTIKPVEDKSGHKRAESLTSSGLGVDSEGSDDENSNISCDSLNSNDPQSNSEDHGYHTPNSEDKTGSPIDQIEYENVIDPEKTDIIQQVADVSRKINNLRKENSGMYTAKLVDPSDLDNYENLYFINPPKTYKKKPPPPPPPAKPSDDGKALPKNLLQDIRSRNVRLAATYPSGEAPDRNSHGPPSPSKHLVEEKTYEERKSEVNTVNRICAMEVDTDQFYNFHLAENVREKENGDEEETFAGVKDYLSREKPAAITSAKGTIRGVKNRVKAGIATFLQLQENKSYKDRDAGKVVVYTTTMGIVRETYQKCLKVKQILRTLMVKFEERDVFMSGEAQEEIRERMKCQAILVPQVFVEGQHIGDAETIERLNEMGELRSILKAYKSADVCSTCKVCGGYRLLPCSVCKGSKKSIHRNHFTAEFVALKCMNCDQVGLTKCYAC